jgi:nitroreductase
MKSLFETMKERVSANNFDPNAKISDQDIRELISYASESPSSFNIQHWRFIAVRGKAEKEKLKAVAYNQAKVADAAVTFIILGDTRAYEEIKETWQPMVQKGAMAPDALEGLAKMAFGMYHSNPQAQRDEAIRSGAMAAMSLMLAAQAKGYASGPMIGFDPAGVKKAFNIAENLVPVMLIAVGPAAPGNWPRKPRLPAEKLLTIIG